MANRPVKSSKSSPLQRRRRDKKGESAAVRPSPGPKPIGEWTELAIRPATPLSNTTANAAQPPKAPAPGHDEEPPASAPVIQPSNPVQPEELVWPVRGQPKRHGQGTGRVALATRSALEPVEASEHGERPSTNRPTQRKADAKTTDSEFANDPDLAEVRRLQGEVLTGLRATLEYVLAAGNILHKKKKQYPGRYQEWVRAAGLNKRTAQRYVRYYLHADEIRHNLKGDTGVASDTGLQLKAGLQSIAKPKLKLDGSPATGADKRHVRPALPLPEQPITNNGEMVRDSTTALSSQLQRIAAGTLSIGKLDLRPALLLLREAIDQALLLLPVQTNPAPVDDEPGGPVNNAAPITLPFTRERIELPRRAK